MSDIALEAASIPAHPSKEDANPYLDARRAWNSQVEKAFTAARTWQIVGIMGLLTGMGSVGGMIWLGSLPRFTPFVIEVDKLGEAVAVRAADRSAAADTRVIRAWLASFISSIRSVTPDIAQQRAATFKVYAMLRQKDPATLKVGEWWNEDKKTSPFQRAENEMVSIDNPVISQISDSVWQVDWQETTRDRDGNMKAPAVRMRATLQVYLAPLNRGATEAEIVRNPLGIFIRDFNWSTIG